jgi:hypothetical protein
MQNQEEIDLEAAITESLAEQKKLIAEQQSVKEKYGIEVDDVSGDGNCFYYAVAKQLKLNNLTSDLGDLNNDDLRRIAIEHLTLNKDMYKTTDQQSQLIIASRDRPDGAAKDYENYLAIHSKDREYADQGMVSALSRALKINIVTLQPEVDPIIQKQNHNLPTLYVYYSHQHYQSVIPDANNPNFTDLTQKVQDHPIDELTAFSQKLDVQLKHKSEIEALKDIHRSIEQSISNTNPMQRKKEVING